MSETPGPHTYWDLALAELDEDLVLSMQSTGAPNPSAYLLIQLVRNTNWGGPVDKRLDDIDTLLRERT